VQAYASARWLMKTIALLLIAWIAVAWICVLAGKTPLARRVIIDFGSCRSWAAASVSYAKNCIVLQIEKQDSP